MSRRLVSFLFVLIVCCGVRCERGFGAESSKLSVLMLGGSGGSHRPPEMEKLIHSALGQRGIDLLYTEKVGDFSAGNLARFDAVLIYKVDGDLPADEEAALIDFVQQGKGLIAVHCASHCFRNSSRYTRLIGGRFATHGNGKFRAKIIDAQHPAMRGLEGFEVEDETYVHNELSDDNRVLMVRDQDDGYGYEPYTWVRELGKGRIFYTALGHDERTWSRPEFHALIENGIRWSVGQLNDEVKIVHLPENYLTADPPEPLSPEESMKHGHMPEGFHLELFAAEPEIIRPMVMAFDERGRAWIIESVDYPNDVFTDAKGHDRIKICEDTDGDGKADKFTIFADGFNIPTALTFWNGGVIVGAAPDILFLKDTNGDDVADERKVLYTGFGKNDTHAVLSNFRYGFDNWIWGTVGYSGGKVTVGDQTTKFGAGIFRFKPDGSGFEFLTPTQSNTWGLGFDESGNVFAGKANNEHVVHFVIPNRIYEGVRGWSGIGNSIIEDHKKFHPATDNVRQVDFNGGYTAAAGMSVYTARAFPKEYWNRAAFVCEPTGHLVHIDFLKPNGSDFIAKDGWNLFASSDPWCAPIDAQVGPDGAVWMLDWYNYIVRHNPTPPGFKTGVGNAYITPQRDKAHGRIYRIMPDGMKTLPSMRLDRADDIELLSGLRDENMLWRHTAQRVLVAKASADVLPDLQKLIDGLDLNLPQDRAAWIHALRAMDGSGAFASWESERLGFALKSLLHPSRTVRQAAVDVLPREAHSARAILGSDSLTSPDFCLRVKALLALAERPPVEEVGPAIFSMLQEPTNAQDPWIPEAAIAAAAKNDVSFLRYAMNAGCKADAIPAVSKVVAVVAEHFARGSDVEATGVIFESLDDAQPALGEALISGFEAGWPENRPAKIDERTGARLAKLLKKLSPEGEMKFASLVSRWGVQGSLKEAMGEIQKSASANLGDAKVGDEARIAAAKLMLGFSDGADTVNSVLKQVSPQASPELAGGLLNALGQSASEAVAPAVIKAWADWSPASRRAGLSLLARRPRWTLALLDALESGAIEKGDLSVDQKQLLLTHPERKLAMRAQKIFAGGSGAAGSNRKEILEALLPVADQHGDPGAGKDVFEKNCMQCHTFNGVGNKVGPELTGIAARPRADILTDILDPNLAVEGNFRQCIITTKDGELITGRLLSETKTSYELLDIQSQKQLILREKVGEFRMSKLSLMPEGFESLPKEDIVSLLDFMTQRSRFFPLPLQRVATVCSAKGMFNGPEADVERLIFPEWGAQTAFGVPFNVIDPQSGTVNNALELWGPIGGLSRQMPREVKLPCHSAAKAIHLLGGVSGWGFPLGKENSVSLIVRLHYAGGATEDHPLLNGVHFADYIRVVDVPGSKLAFKLREQQLRYLSVKPGKGEVIDEIEFVKGEDETAPVIMAVTVEAEEK